MSSLLRYFEVLIQLHFSLKKKSTNNFARSLSDFVAIIPKVLTNVGNIDIIEELKELLSLIRVANLAIKMLYITTS